jgi:ADP-heptose:LPS heptosyltransferase
MGGEAVTSVLVVQLYRIGDVLQSFAVLRGLREKWPQARIDLLVDPLMASAAALSPDLDRVLCYPRPAIREALLGERTDNGLALYLAGAGLGRLRLEGYDLVVNLHQDALGRRLAGCAGACDALGSLAPPLGPARQAGRGTEDFFRAVSDRRRDRRNLVDHFLGMAGLPLGRPGRIAIPRAAQRSADELLEAAPGGGPLVALQAGASRAFRGLDTAWIRAVQAALPRARFVWLGSAGERPGIDAGLSAGLRGANLAGLTTLDTLAALLRRCRLLFTGDTAPLHLAALLAVPSLSVFYGPAQPYETGPYGAGHLVHYAPPDCAPCSHLNGCSDPVCKRGVDAAKLAGAALAMLEGAPPPAGFLVSSFGPRGLAWAPSAPLPALAATAA